MTERQLGEVFSVISSGLQYRKFLKLNKGEPPKRRDSVEKLFGSVLDPQFNALGRDDSFFYK